MTGSRPSSPGVPARRRRSSARRRRPCCRTRATRSPPPTSTPPPRPSTRPSAGRPGLNRPLPMPRPTGRSPSSGPGSPHGEKVSREELEKRRLTRKRILIGLQGFDAAGMRRLGVLHAKATSRLYSYGTDRTPKWLRALASASDIARRHRCFDDGPPILTAPRIRDMLAVEGSTTAPLVDLLFGGSRWRPTPEDSMADLVLALCNLFPQAAAPLPACAARCRRPDGGRARC